jgi:hypothetical protein
VVSARDITGRSTSPTSSSDDKADLAGYAKRKERAKKFEEKIEQKGLMMAEVERRIDVVVVFCAQYLGGEEVGGAWGRF